MSETAQSAPRTSLRVGDEHRRRGGRNALLAQRDEIRQLAANVSQPVSIERCLSFLQLRQQVLLRRPLMLPCVA